MVESSQPVVKAWDRIPPARKERPVGTWDVIPTTDRVQTHNVQRAEIPDEIKAQLRAEARRTGQTVTATADVRYQHDLDSGETDARPRLREIQRPQARPTESDSSGADPWEESGALSGTLTPQYEQLLEKLIEKPQPRGRQLRRGHLKDGRVEMPQIVVVTEPTQSGRRGGD